MREPKSRSSPSALRKSLRDARERIERRPPSRSCCVNDHERGARARRTNKCPARQHRARGKQVPHLIGFGNGPDERPLTRRARSRTTLVRRTHTRGENETEMRPDWRRWALEWPARREKHAERHKNKKDCATRLNRPANDNCPDPNAGARDVRRGYQKQAVRGGNVERPAAAAEPFIGARSGRVKSSSETVRHY